jgi:hypothetical protein
MISWIIPFAFSANARTMASRFSWILTRTWWVLNRQTCCLSLTKNQWSRFSGGSGAPYWTLAACGIEPAGITPTLAAIIHSEWPNTKDPDPASVPAMIWGTNYSRLLAMTVFTMFFGGRTYAPKCIIDDQNIQDWLQSHYIAAVGQLADRISAASDLADTCVLGWDSMNEPHHGMIGLSDLNASSEEGTSQLKKGPTPTPAQSFRLGMGTAQTVATWTFGSFGPMKTGTTTIDPKGVRLWANASMEDENGVNPRWGWRRDPGWRLGTCPWAQHGVWDPSTGEILKPTYFARDDFIPTLWKDHYVAYAERIRAAQPNAILFVAPPVFAQPPEISEDILKGRACLSTHYYDGLTLVTRHWNWFNADALGILRGKYKSPALGVRVGEAAIRKSIREQLGVLKSDASILGQYPTIIGEIGIPYDMDGRAAYGNTDGGKHKGDYSAHQKALDASLNACDGSNALNYTVWTYCPDSSHQWGDGWNMEDLSLWSPDDLRVRASAESYLPSGKSSVIAASIATPAPWRNPYDFLTDGARAVKAFARPYPVATVGIPTSIEFDLNKAHFKLVVRVTAEDAPSNDSSDLAGDSSSVATEIFVPLVHFAHSALLGQVEHTMADGQEPPAGSSITLAGDDADISLLDLDVQVSAGRWEVEGQILRWWYPIPAGRSDAVSYDIVIKRSSGAIKATYEHAGAVERCAEWSGNACQVM